MNSIVLLSGGIDSAVSLLDVLQREVPQQVLALYINYRSKHGPRERQHAWHLASYYQTEFEERYANFDHERSSLLCGQDGSLAGADTIVPGRNQAFINIALDLAKVDGAREIIFSPHKGDAEIYPDCCPEFVAEMAEVCQAQGVALKAPWLDLEKWEVVQRGLDLGLNLDWTWSCYCPTRFQDPCGDCGACQERAKALDIALKVG